MVMPVIFFSSAICRSESTSIPSTPTSFIRRTASRLSTGPVSSISRYSPSLSSPIPSGLAKDMIMWGLYPPVNAIGISARRITFWKYRITSRCPIKRRTPYFLNLILAFNTDTSSETCGSAAGTLLPAVRGHGFIYCTLPLPAEKGTAQADIDKIPGKDLVFSTHPLIVEIDIHTGVVKGLHPQVIAEGLRPGIKQAAQAVGLFDHFSHSSVAPGHDAFQHRAPGVVPVIFQAL